MLTLAQLSNLTFLADNCSFISKFDFERPLLCTNIQAKQVPQRHIQKKSTFDTVHDGFLLKRSF